MNFSLSEKDIDAADYNSRHRDIVRFEALCRECPNYGMRWGCPPFDADVLDAPSHYKTLRLYLLKIENLGVAEGLPQEEAVRRVSEIIQKARLQYEKRLLEFEKTTSGMAMLFTGMCPHCRNVPCTRCQGEKCRHPEAVRPSLEALGYDVCATSKEVFGEEMEWIRNGRIPHQICLVGGVFYNF